MVGQTLAHYKILEKIGSGGMGEVYLTEDTKLGRKVALKVLPPELAENEDRRARFTREAKAIAALDHPNIVQVFSVEEAEGIHFITMQLVHGKTLTETLVIRRLRGTCVRPRTVFLRRANRSSLRSIHSGDAAKPFMESEVRMGGGGFEPSSVSRSGPPPFTYNR